MKLSPEEFARIDAGTRAYVEAIKEVHEVIQSLAKLSLDDFATTVLEDPSVVTELIGEATDKACRAHNESLFGVIDSRLKRPTETASLG